MKLIKTLGAVVLSGTMLAAVTGTASADDKNRYGSRGYVSQNTKGYGGGYTYSRQGNHPGYHRNWGDRGRYDNRDWNQRRDHDRWRRDGYHGQSYQSNNRHRYYYPNRSYGRSGFSFNFGYYQPRYRWNPYQRVVYAPNYHRPNYHPRYRVGHRFSNYNSYLINDWQRWGLYQPPHGYYWARHDNDAYLTAAGTGVIAGIIIGALAAGH